MKILVTGCGGFIGYHLTKKLLENKKNLIVGVDNINSYYSTNLKKDRLSILKNNKNFIFFKLNINSKKLTPIFEKHKFKYVINLAAQAGVRHSISNPEEYFDSNIVGFFNLINLSKKYKVKHFIFASTSSVYGDAKIFPTPESANTDKPESFYAASKKCNEVIAYSYSNSFNLPCTGLRFFTVYGPMGRPDMALYKFVNSILNKSKINVFNKGKHIRDFTYIDDVINYLLIIINKIPHKEIPFKIFNIGSNRPKSLNFFVSLIRKNIGTDFKIKMLNFQKGDVYKTHADNSLIKKYTKKEFYTPIDKGIKNFILWYKKKKL